MPQSCALTVLRAVAAVSGFGLWGCGAAPGAAARDAGGSEGAAPARSPSRATAAYRVDPSAAPDQPSVTCWVHATFGRSDPDAKGLRMLAVARICVPASAREAPR